jgi:hypothetical protein
MIRESKVDVSEDHPLRQLFLTLAERGMGQTPHPDWQVVKYLADLLTEFVHRDNLHRITSDAGQRLLYLSEMLAEASSQMSPHVRQTCFKHVGDLALFNLGLFPEHLTYGRRLLSPDYYAAQGRRSYSLAAESEYNGETVVLRKLSDQFETCVTGLHWVKAYMQDPFFQYMFREFDVT